MDELNIGYVDESVNGYFVTRRIAKRVNQWGPFQSYEDAENILLLAQQCETEIEAGLVEKVIKMQGHMYQAVGVYQNIRGKFNVRLSIAGELLSFGDYRDFRKANLIAARAYKCRTIAEAFDLRKELGVGVDGRITSRKKWNKQVSKVQYDVWCSNTFETKNQKFNFDEVLERFNTEAQPLITNLILTTFTNATNEILSNLTKSLREKATV